MEKRIIMPPTIIALDSGVISIEKCAKVIESLA